MSRNVTQLSEPEIEPGSSLLVPNDLYSLQQSRQEETVQSQSKSSVSVSVSQQIFQQRNSQPVLTKAEVANPNNCYVVYLSLPDSRQMIMPLMTGVTGGVRMLNQQLSQSQDGCNLNHNSGVMSSLPARTSSPGSSLVVSSTYNTQSDGIITGQPSDKNRPPVAVVVPWNSVASSYQSNGSQSTRESLSNENQRNLPTMPSVMIYQPSNSQLSALLVRSHQQSTDIQEDSLQSAVQQNLNHSLAVRQSLARQMLTQQSSEQNSQQLIQQAANQQLTQQVASQQLTQQVASQQLTQQQDCNQLLSQQRISSQQLSSQSDGHLQLAAQQQGVFQQSFGDDQLHQLPLPAASQQLLRQTGSSQQSVDQMSNSKHSTVQDNGLHQSTSDPANCPQITAQEGNQQQQLTASSQHLTLQPTVHQQMLALQLCNSQPLPQQGTSQHLINSLQGNLQQLIQQPNSNQLSASQRLALPHGCPQRLGIVPTQGISPRFLVQQGIPQQLLSQNRNNQPLALVLGSCEQVNPNLGTLSQGDIPQKGNIQLTELQQRINQQSNLLHLQSKHDGNQLRPRIAQILNLPNQLQNGNCLQLEQQKQLSLQQRQLQQQQKLQQQQVINHLGRVPDGIHVNLSMGGRQSDSGTFNQDKNSINSLLHCISGLNSVDYNSRNQANTSGNEKSAGSALKYVDSVCPNETAGPRFSVSQEKPPVSDTERVRTISNNNTLANSFAGHSVDHLPTNNEQFLSCSGAEQNSCVTSVNCAAMQDSRFSFPPLRATATIQNQLQTPVAKPSVQSYGAAVDDGSLCNTNHINGPSFTGRNVHMRPVAGLPKYPSSQMSTEKIVQYLGAPSVRINLPNTVPPSDGCHQDYAVGDRQVDRSGLRSVKVVPFNAMQNNVSAPGTCMSLNAYTPSTVVHLRMTTPPGQNISSLASSSSSSSSSAMLHVNHSDQMRLQNFPPSLMSQFPRPQQNCMSSNGGDKTTSNCPRLPNHPLTTSPGFQNVCHVAAQAAPALVSNGVQELQTVPQTKQASATKFFINVQHPDPNLSSPDLMSAGQQLEIGQECELRYFNGHRLMTIWDGKYFKLKNPLYQSPESDPSNVSAVRLATCKGGGVAQKDGQELASSGSTAGLRMTVSESITSLVPAEIEGCSSLTVSLARPSLHPETDRQSKAAADLLVPGSTSSSSSTSPSVAASASKISKRPREEGKFAVCQHCGAFSCDYDCCDQCRRPLPADVKLYEPGKKAKVDATGNNSTTSPAAAHASVKKQNKKFEGLTPGTKRPLAEDDSSFTQKTPNPALKVTPLPRKPSSRQHRKQEAEIVHILSSDDEEEEEDPLGSRNSVSRTSAVPHKMKKLKGESQSSDASSCEQKPLSASSHPPNSQPPVNRILGPPSLTASVLHTFFGFIRYDKKCLLKLEWNMMSLQPVDTNDCSLLTIDASDIQMVAGHINRLRGLNCLFFLVTPAKADGLRKLLTSEPTAFFNPESTEDCAKYIVLFLSEQRAGFLSSVEHIVESMQGSAKPQYKQIDNFDVEKYLQKVCPSGDLQTFIQTSNKSPAAVQAADHIPKDGQKRSQENEEEANEEMDYGSRSPSPVHALFSGQIIKLFTYPPPPSTGGIAVTNEDLFCLNEGEFLNDVIIDFYLKYLMMEFLSNKFQQTHIFSSFFYRRLTQKPSRRHKEEEDLECTSIQQRRHSRVRTWTRHVDLFEKDFVIVPINESAHWYLAIVCYPGLSSPEIEHKTVKESVSDEMPELNPKNDGKKVTESKSKSRARSDTAGKTGSGSAVSQNVGGRKGRARSKKAAQTKSKSEQCVKKMPCILVFDSLAGPGRNGVIRILREYLQVEWDVKKKEKHGPRLFTKDSMKGATPDCPQQSNFSDCGIYVLQYVESFFTDPIEDFTFPLKLLGKWFDEGKVKNKRASLQQLILSMQKRYNPGLDYNPESDGCIIRQEGEELTSSISHAAV